MVNLCELTSKHVYFYGHSAFSSFRTDEGDMSLQSDMNHSRKYVGKVLHNMNNSMQRVYNLA